MGGVNMGWQFYNASGQRLSSVADKTATQAEMEAASSTTAYVTPGRAQHHPGVVKASVRIASAGTIESNDYNVASITDTATGNRTIVWDVDFDNEFYAVASTNSTNDSVFARHTTFAAGSVVLQVVNAANSALADSGTSTIAVGVQV